MTSKEEDSSMTLKLFLVILLIALLPQSCKHSPTNTELKNEFETIKENELGGTFIHSMYVVAGRNNGNSHFKMYKTASGYRFFWGNYLTSLSPNSELLSDTTTYLTSAIQKAKDELKKAREILKSSQVSYEQAKTKLGENNDKTRELVKIVKVSDQEVDRHSELVFTLANENKGAVDVLTQIFKVVDEGSPRVIWGNEIIGDLGTENPKLKYLYIAVRALLRTSITDFHSLVKYDTVVPVDPNKTEGNYQNKNLKLRISGGPEERLFFVGPQRILLRRWSEYENVGIFAAAVKDGKVYPVKKSEGKTPFQLHGLYFTPDKTLSPPYFILAKESFLPDPRIINSNQKLMDAGSFSRSTSVSTAGWDFVEFTFYDWRGYSLEFKSLEDSSNSQTNFYRLVNPSKLPYEEKEVFYVTDRSIESSISPNEFKGLFPDTAIAFSLIDLVGQAHSATEGDRNRLDAFLKEK